MDDNGDVAWREQYTPFGEQLQSPVANDNLDGFTGHIKDRATGLNYMQARYYDPVIGRFLSVDPMGMMEMDLNPGYFNRYAYTMNNPITFKDPTGEWLLYFGADVKAGSVVGGGGGGGIYIGSKKDGGLDFGTYTTTSLGAVVGGEAGMEVGGSTSDRITVEDLAGTSVGVEVNGYFISGEASAVSSEGGEDGHADVMYAVGVGIPSVGASTSVSNTTTNSVKDDIADTANNVIDNLANEARERVEDFKDYLTPLLREH